jgi:outer membrane murein-binding lipoprotein Lpp
MENRPLVNNQPVLQTTKTSPKNFPTSAIILISVILTAVIVGGGVYWWQGLQLKSAEDNLASVQKSLQQQIDDLKAQVAASQAAELQAAAAAENKIEEYLLFQDDTYHFRVAGTTKSCADYYDFKVREALAGSIKSYDIFVPGSKSWAQGYPLEAYAIYTEESYNKLPSGEMVSKPQIIMRLDNGDLLTWWQPQDSPPDIPQDCRINFERF